MVEWNVQNFVEPDDGMCPVCGDSFEIGREFYDNPQFSYGVGAAENGPDKVCVELRFINNTHTLLVYYHHD